MFKRLGWSQGQSGQVRKNSSPPGFDPRTVQPIASRYTDYATGPILTGMGTNWPPIPQVSGVKQSLLEADDVPLSTIEGKNEWSYIRDESRRSMVILPKNWRKFYFISRFLSVVNIMFYMRIVACLCVFTNTCFGSAWITQCIWLHYGKNPQSF